MRVIDLLENCNTKDIAYIDVYNEDKKELCLVSCPDRWQELLSEKVLNSELVTFSIRKGEECGLLIDLVVGKNQSYFRNLSPGVSEEDILDVIKDFNRFVKEKEDKQNGCMD